MKKLFSFLMIAVALIAFSCNRAEEGQEFSGPKAKVTYTVAGPEGVATKTMGTIGSEYTLYYEVRLDGEELGSKLEGTGLSGSKVVAANDWPVSVEFDLARNLQYKVLFWAQSNSAPAELYTVSDLTAVTIDYNKMAANEEKCDVFAGSDVITPAGPTSASVTLERPLALLNLGTADAVQYHTSSGGLTVGNVSATVSGLLANTFNVATGTAGAGAETEFTVADAPIDANTATTLSVGEKAYNYLNAVYVLPAAGEGTLGVSYTIKDNNSANITSLAVTNVPVKSNYRTNIAGKLLTGTATYTVDVDNDFTNDADKVVAPVFGSVDALNAYFATMADNSDNGDINPEEVILSAAAAGSTIYLPKIATNVVIRLNAVCNGKLTIEYAEGATDGQKPARIDFYASKLTNLEATVPASHFELITGSVVTEQAIVATNTTTFVIQKGARVGTVKIQQGNANIGGEVEILEVAKDATADGTNPVGVFLAKDAGVEQINLIAPANVVVEQPKDNIDVNTTDNKVCVNVASTAVGSSATAQNGGQIYVQYVGAETEINAKGAESGVYIEEVKEDVQVVTDATDGAKIETNTGVVVDEIIRTVEQFDAAVAAKKATMVIGNDITFDKGYQLDFSTSIDLGGNKLNFNGVVPAARETHTAGFTQSRAFKITGDANFTIKNGEILLNEALLGAVRFDSTGKLVMEDIHTTNSRGWGLNIKLEDGTAELKNVKIDSQIGGGIEVNGPAKATLSGCTFTQTGVDTQAWISTPLSVAYGGVLTVASGTYSGHYGAYVYTSGGTINLNGGSVSGTVAAVMIQKDNANYTEHNAIVNIISGVEVNGKVEADNANCLLTITGGTFEKGTADKLIDIKPAASAVITGGTFSEAPDAAYMPDGYSAIPTGDKYVVAIAPKVLNVSTAEEFNNVFSSASTVSKNTIININADIDLTEVEAHTPVSISNTAKASITVNGNNHTIKGMKKPMFDHCFVVSIAVNNLTFTDCHITDTGTDSNGYSYCAVIVGEFDAGKQLNIENVNITNCELTGTNYVGAIYGSGGGYGNQNDGPVHMGAIVKNCTISGCTFTSTGGGSVGAIAGHAAWNDWTKLTVENCSVTNCQMTTSKSVKAGSYFGTIGVAGSNPLYGMECGIFVKNCTRSGNTATANGVVSPYIFGRVGSNGGGLWVFVPAEGEYVLAAHRANDVETIDRPDLVTE